MAQCNLITYFFFCLIFSGCTAPLIKEPLGSQPIESSKLAHLEGEWRWDGAEDEANLIRATVKDEKTGLVLLEYENDDGLQEAEVYFRNGGENIVYVTFKVDAEEQAEDYQYSFMRASIYNDVVLVWLWRDDAFLKAVREGRIEARLSDPNSETPSAIYFEDVNKLQQLIEIDDGLEFFLWQSPMVYVRQH